VVATLVNRAVLALIGAALGGMSVVMLLAHGSPAVARVSHCSSYSATPACSLA